MTPQKIIYESTSNFGGVTPSVSFREPITIEAFREIDDDPLFVTLPLMQVGAQSRNGRTYPRETVESLYEQLLEGINGELGHADDETFHNGGRIPEIYWVGATMDEAGCVWGKGYVPKSNERMREHIRLLKSTRGKIGTSIYALGEMDDENNVINAELQTVDIILNPKRVGVPITAAHPVVTTETIKEANFSDGQWVTWDSSGGQAVGRIERVVTSGTLDVPDSDLGMDASEANPAYLIRVHRRDAENAWQPTDTLVGHREDALASYDANTEKYKKKDMQTVEPETTQTVVQEGTARESARNAKLLAENARLLEAQKTLEQVVAEIGKAATISSTDNPVFAAMTLRTQLESAQRENHALLETTITQSVADAVKFPALRPMIANLLENNLSDPTRDGVKHALEHVMSLDYVKEALAAQVQETMGEPAQEPKSPISEANQHYDELPGDGEFFNTPFWEVM